MRHWMLEYDEYCDTEPDIIFIIILIIFHMHRASSRRYLQSISANIYICSPVNSELYIAHRAAILELCSS